MPLSENEQRLLEQMERALYAEDPKFASAMRGGSARARARRRLLLGGLGLVVGLALVLVGVARPQVWVGIAGFVVMLLGLVFAFSPDRRRGPVAAAPGGPVPPGGPASSRGPSSGGATAVRRPGRPGRGRRSAGSRQGFMARMEQRWERRRGGWDR